MNKFLKNTILPAVAAIIMISISGCGGHFTGDEAVPTAAPADIVVPKTSTISRPAGKADEAALTSESRGDNSNRNSSAVVYMPSASTAADDIQLPYCSGDNNLRIVSVNPFDGNFVESGADTYVSGITSAMVLNEGDKPIQYARISLQRGNTLMEFELTNLPVGEYMVVQERNAVPYSEGASYRSIMTEVSELNYLEMSEKEISVSEDGSGSLVIKNISGRTIPRVSVFYKSYSADRGAFIGGITYTSSADNLAPGEIRYLEPSHYVCGASRVVSVRTFD